MRVRLRSVAAALAAATLALSGCGGSGNGRAGEGNVAARNGLVPVTVSTAGGARHAFEVELADTGPEQQRGLMFRTDIPENGGMLFAPYPPEGGGAREASFWMKDTPSALDIIFIRGDGTIAAIAQDTVPFSEIPVTSGEPVSAVLELRAGRTAALGIAAGDRATWPGQPGG